MKNEIVKGNQTLGANPEEIQIRYLMKIPGISRKEIEEMLQLYGVPARSIIDYISIVRHNGLIKE